MRSRGKLVSATRNITNNRLIVSFEVEATAEEVNGLTDKDLSIEVKRYSPKRTLTANAYYWVLVSKLSDATGSTNAEIHSILLRSYGSLFEVGGQLVEFYIPDTPEAYKKALNDECIHCKPTSSVRWNELGDRERMYHLLKGSSDMTKEEFSRLLDGCIQECKDVGIETMTPDELARLRW